MFQRGGPTVFELATQALSETDRGYTLLAPKFDKTPFRTPDALLEDAAAWAGPADHIVDLCCGTGAAMAAFRPYARQEITGVDRNGAMLGVARASLESDPGTPFSLEMSDILTWDGRGRFDLAVSFGAFGHILTSDEDRFLDVVFRALKPGGRFLFVTGRRPVPQSPAFWAAHAFNGAMRLRNLLIRPPFHMYYLTFTWPEIGAKLTAAGFQVQVHEGVFRPPYSRALLIEAARP